MKVAIVSFGHADSAIPMAKWIAEKADVELFFTFSLNKKKNNVIDFEDVDVTTGLQDKETTEKSFSKEVKEYVNKQFPVHLFIYKNLKLKSAANWDLSRKYAKILRKFDVIHFNGKNMSILQLKVFMPFKKFVFTIHDLENHTGEQAKNFVGRNLNKYIIKSKSPIVIQNKTDYNEVLELYPNKKKKIHFIPFGILEIYKHYKNEEFKAPEHDVLFFGRISPYKGIEYFIKAIQKLKKDYPNIKAVIAGSGKFYFDTSDIRQDKSFSIINKFIQSDELVELIKASKIVVCPYTDATQSGVAMTAFVFNKPVIATNVGGFKDVIKDNENGFLVPPKDADSIYEKLKLMLDTPNMIDELTENIKAGSQDGEFAWTKIADEYIRIYN